ncbi:hypothetical protein Patl1_09707 [Pistacia atlantica]|uniref:Uncharacterized protein n=1 Tax=Pistacia atlantica TaxID=434234 RepID=A0ACC1A8E8_9ROSI|nr:hypothetical protein Patl1_09707 [Pistacia atlantica]
MDTKYRPWLMISFLFICFSLKFHVSSGANTISANLSLSGDQTILSAGGVFKLGFFKPGKSSNYYIGIWYDKISVQTVVWVANREKPVFDKYSSVLRISDGNLVLFDESKVPVWSTSITSTTTSSLEAILLDEGNLVLRELSGNSSTSLWESFDHPTHTLIPGMKMRLDKRTKVSKRLISWKNAEDPAPGLFSLELDPVGSNSFIIMWNNSQLYWFSGPWDENKKLFDFGPNPENNAESTRIVVHLGAALSKLRSSVIVCKVFSLNQSMIGTSGIILVVVRGRPNCSVKIIV